VQQTQGFFFSQFCDLATMATTHKMKEPNLVIGQKQQWMLVLNMATSMFFSLKCGKLKGI
jgi:hypothetical protein